MTTLREKLIKIGAKVVNHARYTIFQMAEIAVPREPFDANIDRIRELMRRIPDAPTYCTANGVKPLKGHYHENWNFHVVRTGDRLSLGPKELVFVEALKYYANILTPFTPLVEKKFHFYVAFKM